MPTRPGRWRAATVRLCPGRREGDAATHSPLDLAATGGEPNGHMIIKCRSSIKGYCHEDRQSECCLCLLVLYGRGRLSRQETPSVLYQIVVAYPTASQPC